MKKKLKHGTPGTWKTNWLEYSDGPKFFTMTTLKVLVCLVWLTFLSLTRSAAIFALLCLVVAWFFKLVVPEAFIELKASVATEELPDTLTLIVIALLWHGIVVDAFSLWGKWKNRKRKQF